MCVMLQFISACLRRRPMNLILSQRRLLRGRGPAALHVLKLVQLMQPATICADVPSNVEIDVRTFVQCWLIHYGFAELCDELNECCFRWGCCCLSLRNIEERPVMRPYRGRRKHSLVAHASLWLSHLLVGKTALGVAMTGCLAGVQASVQNFACRFNFSAERSP